MIKLIFKCFVVSLFLIPGTGFAADAQAVEQGDKGIEAFRQGNLISAMELLSKSAEKGYAPAQVTLAYIMDQAEENDRAFELFGQAAKQDNAAAQFGLGSMYAKGEGTPKDPYIAGQYIKKSALQSHAPAMRAYAYALESGGLGFDRHLDQALHWFQQCHEADDKVCTRRLVNIYENGELGLPVNKEKADVFRRQLSKAQE